MSDLRTFRSKGLIVVSWVTVAILAGLMIFIGLNMPESMKFSMSGNITMWLLIGAWAFLAWAISRSKVTADSEKIVIVNGLRTYTFAWSDVAALSMNPGAPWPTLITQDDRRVMLFGLQGSEGKSTRNALAWLREHVA